MISHVKQLIVQIGNIKDIKSSMEITNVIQSSLVFPARGSTTATMPCSPSSRLTIAGIDLMLLQIDLTASGHWPMTPTALHR